MVEYVTKKEEKRAEATLDPTNVVILARAAAEAHEQIAGEREGSIILLQKQIQRYATAIEHVSEGVCFFGRDQRLILCNRRYTEIYGLNAGDVLPGMSLREIVAKRDAAGTSPMATDEYLAVCDAINAGTKAGDWTAALPDGCRIQIRHFAMPGGGWISTHEDITDAARTVANERITLQTLVDWVPDNLWVKDSQSRFVIANRATASRMGMASPEELIGKSDLELAPPETARQYFADEQRVIATGEPLTDKEEYVVGTFGQKTWILTTKVPLRDDRGTIVGLVGVSRDISDRRRADLLRASQAEILEQIAVGASLESVLDKLIALVEMQIPGTHGAVLLADDGGGSLRWGAAPNVAVSFVKAQDGMRVRPEGPSSAAAVHRRQPVVVADMLNDPRWSEHRDLVAAHAYRSCWSVPIIASDARPLGALTLYSKIQREPDKEMLAICEEAAHIAGIAVERKLSEDRIRFMATHDALTGLPNRTLLQDRIEQALRYAQRADRWVTVAFIDLDNFKGVNDTLGHNAGDELLRSVAKRMVSCLRGVDSVVRLGGDEFVVLLVDQAKSSDAISATIDKLRASIVAPLQIGNQTLRVTCSIGLANYPNDGMDGDALTANADAAMYRAKELGRDNAQFYTPELNARVREEFLLQEDLRGAFERKEFVLYYQPQVDLLTSQVLAVEALIRWNHPTHGLIPPNRFIPIAEQTGLIIPIGDWVLREACRQNKAWQDAGFPPIRVCVNVSARQFAEKKFTSRVISALEASGLDARYLELELTESLIMQDVAQALTTMNELQRLGIQLAIDDFGTGYSSLSALKTFPVARLKIDKSFIKGLPSNVDDRAVATAIISLGKKLNMHIIAEGVENDDQIAFLRNNKCEELQGFRFSTPLPPGELEAFLSTDRTAIPPSGS